MPAGTLSLDEAPLASRLEPRGRILEDPDHYIWGISPLYGPDGRVHVFYSRWPKEDGWTGYIYDCEVAHAVADDPAGPYEPAAEPVALSGAFGDSEWDAMSIHNPDVHRVGDRYVMLYYGSNIYDVRRIEGKLGLAVADSLDGPWERNPENPIITRGERGDWDSVAVNTPTFLTHPDGRYYVYYRSWTGRNTGVRNDKIGVAIAEDLEGPYKKYEDNPVIDPTTIELERVTAREAREVGLEDPLAFVNDDGRISILARDMGIAGGRASPGKGLLFDSDDGFEFSHDPTIAYHEAEHYYPDGEMAADSGRYGRFERPKFLFADGEPTHLFNAIVGGEYGLSTGHVFELVDR